MGKRIKKDIIDNSKDITMQKILNSEIPLVKQLDISTGYFDVRGYGMLREELDKAAKDPSFELRLLLGKDAILPMEGSFEKLVKQHEEFIKMKDQFVGERKHQGPYWWKQVQSLQMLHIWRELGLYRL